MKKILCSLMVLAIMLAVTLVPTKVNALNTNYDITGKTATEITNDVFELLEGTSVGDTITLIGNNSFTDETLGFDIPAGVKVIWQANASFTMVNFADMVVIAGNGTFEVASGSITGTKATTTGITGIYVSVGNSNIVVSGGTINISAPDWAAGIFLSSTTGNLKITGGHVTATGGTTAMAIAIADSAPSSVYAAYLTGTITGTAYTVGNHNIFEISTLTIPTSWNGTNNGITMATGSLNPVSDYEWVSTGGVPHVTIIGGDIPFSFPWGAYESEPNFCDLNPTDPQCSEPEPNFCDQNPTHPQCSDPEPNFCEQNPTDPKCLGTTDKEENPETGDINLVLMAISTLITSVGAVFLTRRLKEEN